MKEPNYPEVISDLNWIIHPAVAMVAVAIAMSFGVFGPLIFSVFTVSISLVAVTQVVNAYGAHIIKQHIVHLSKSDNTPIHDARINRILKTISISSTLMIAVALLSVAVIYLSVHTLSYKIAVLYGCVVVSGLYDYYIISVVRRFILDYLALSSTA